MRLVATFQPRGTETHKSQTPAVKPYYAYARFESGLRLSECIKPQKEEHKIHQGIFPLH